MANMTFEKEVNRFIVRDDGVLKTRVCVVCDCFVLGGNGKISVSFLKKNADLFLPSQSIPIALQLYYTAPNAQSSSRLLLSPRAVKVFPGEESSDFIVCLHCETSLK